MKLCATNLLSLLFFLSVLQPLAQTNTCNCPEPPGGSVLCEKNLIPVCIIKDGKVVASCVEIKRSNFTDEQLTVVLLSTLFKGRVTAAEMEREMLYRDIRRAGGLRAGQLSLTFRLPTGEQPTTALEALPEVTNPEKIKALSEFTEERLRTSPRVKAREVDIPTNFIRKLPPYVQ